MWAASWKAAYGIFLQDLVNRSLILWKVHSVHLLFSVPAVKGVEFGLGFGFADLYGSEANDAILYDHGFRTATNHNGGINGRHFKRYAYPTAVQ